MGLYNEDPRLIETELRESHETAVEDDWEEIATNSVEIWKSACEEKTFTCDVDCWNPLLGYD
jgi:hypothetical protein